MIENPLIKNSNELLERIGTGKYGDVYKVRDKANNKEFALKVIIVKSNDIIYSAMEDLNNILAMDHPNIMKFYLGIKLINIYYFY